MGDFIKPKFGELVDVEEKFERHNVQRQAKKYDGTVLDYKEWWKVWELVPYAGGKGIFLGMRNLRNGPTEYDIDVGTIFHAQEYFQAMLVCCCEGENPVYVPIPAT